MSIHSLVPSLDLVAFVAARDRCIARLAEARAAIDEVVAICGRTQIADQYTLNRVLGGDRYILSPPILSPGWLGRATKAVDASAWDTLLTASGLRSFMDAEAREAWDKQLQDDMPPISAETVTATFRHLHEQRRMMFNRGVVNLFHRLSPRYKTNSVWAFRHRMIVNRAFSYPPFATLEHDTMDMLDDLARALAGVDNVPEPDYRQGIYQQASEALRRGDITFKTPYFDIRLYRNARTAHVHVTRADLLDGLNRILATEYGLAVPFDRHAEEKGGVQ